MTLSFLDPLPEGRRRVILLALGFMCVSSAALIGRTAGDALFLERYSLSGLSYMYMGTAVVVGSVAFVYGLFAGRMAITRLICAGIGTLVFGLIALRLGLSTPHSGYRIAAYFIGDLVVNVPMILFWSFAAMLFNPREAKRVFGFVGAGGTTACIFAGFIVKPFTMHFGAANLLLVCAGLLLAFVAIALRISRLESGRFQSQVMPGRRTAYYTNLLKSHQVRSLALLVFATHIALTLIDYQFKAGARLHHSPDQLAGFFGNFYGFSSVVALFIQLLLVHRILQKGGVQLGLVILPASLLIGSIGTALSGQFGWMIATKFAVQICLFTIDVAAIQMLYLGIPVQTRNQARAFIEGIGKPIAIAVTGIGLVGAAAFLPLSALAMGAIAAIAFWLWLSRINHKAYVTALIDSLGSRRFDPSQETEGIQDKTVATHIKQAIDDASDEEIIYLLGLTSTIDTIDWTPEYRRLLQRQSPAVKIEALNYLKDHGDESDVPSVIAQFDHAQPDVRAASVRTLATLGGMDVIAHIESALEDPEPEVRAAAIAILINSGDLDHLINAGGALKSMLESPEASDRVAAAHALTGIRSAVLLRSLVGLLQDKNSQVRKTALKACRTHTDHRLIPVITTLLSDPAVAYDAAMTIVAYGSPAIDHLIPYLELREADGAFPGAHHIPDILVAIGDLGVLPKLLQTAETSDLQMRHKALCAYCKLVQTAPSIKPYRNVLLDWVRREITLAQQRRLQCRTFAQIPGSTLLIDALQEACETHQDNAVLLLDTTLPEVNLQAVFSGLRSAPGANRANALEILDNVLPKSVKSHILSFYEDPVPSLPLSATAADIYPFLTGCESTWIASGALVLLIENKWPLPDQTLAPCLNHAQAVVRETALYALHLSADPEAFRTQCHRFENDPDAGVRRLAHALIS